MHTVETKDPNLPSRHDATDERRETVSVEALFDRAGSLHMQGNSIRLSSSIMLPFDPTRTISAHCTTSGYYTFSVADMTTRLHWRETLCALNRSCPWHTTHWALHSDTSAA